MRASLNTVRRLAAMVTIGLLPLSAAQAATTTPESAFLAYGAALNAGDARGAADLFTTDAVFAQEGMPVVVGRDAIFANFEGLFAVVAFDLDFTILSNVTTGDEATIRSQSAGTLRIGGGDPVAARFREVFLLRRDDNESFLINRYEFGPAAAGVPEPATWALLIVGFGAVGSTLRYRRTATDGPGSSRVIRWQPLRS